jgi:hypothetical protein
MSKGSRIHEQRECVDCGDVFAISVTEVNFYRQRDLVLPKRCSPCRRARNPTREITASRTHEERRF